MRYKLYSHNYAHFSKLRRGFKTQYYTLSEAVAAVNSLYVGLEDIVIVRYYPTEAKPPFKLPTIAAIRRAGQQSWDIFPDKRLDTEKDVM